MPYGMAKRLLRAFVRTKHLTTEQVEATELRRCLSTFHLTALGVGGTLGAGVYVLAGEVARKQAGPALVISFAIAAVASLLSGLCYAEFGARVPKAGSAYIYSYVTIGELCAFVIGWNMLLEYVFGTSAVARAWSDFFNALCDDCIHDFFIKHLGSLKVSWMSDYPDILAFSFVVVLTAVITCGVAESSALNILFTIINVATILFFTVAGLVFADAKNWDDFIPFGFHGIMSGAAKCFFAFVGFDVIATTGEETKNPRKSIPRATIASLLVVFVAYECTSVTLTLMTRYDQLPKSSALASVFDHRGFPAAKYIVTIGAICALSSSALNSLFPIPRILYSMASDGLIFRFFAKVNERRGTPVIACGVSGILTAVLAMLLDLDALVEMLSIGTLLSYTIVSICVLVLRYRPGNLIEDSAVVTDRIIEDEVGNNLETVQEGESVIERANFVEKSDQKTTTANIEKRSKATDLFSASVDFSESSLRVEKRVVGRPHKAPNAESLSIVKVALGIFIVSTTGFQCCLKRGFNDLSSNNPVIIIIFILCLMMIVFAVAIIAQQPQSEEASELAFKVPYLPYLPLMAVFVNIFLLLELNYMTWIRFAVWMVLGGSIYIFYGVRHSSENEDNEETARAGYIEISDTASGLH